MSGYSGVERKIATTLDSFPRIKSFLKYLYQRLQYFISPKKGIQNLNPGVHILTPFDWAGLSDSQNQHEYFFGYYDKSPWSYNMNKMLLHRKKISDIVELVVFDRKSNTETKVGESRAFSAQQGTMAGWLPGSDRYIIYNTLKNKELVCLIKDISEPGERKIPMTYQAAHPKGEFILGVNYKRIYQIDPQYGYQVDAENYTDELNDINDGVFGYDLNSNDLELVVSIEELINHKGGGGLNRSKSFINHILYNPTGSKFVFILRWVNQSGKFSRLYVCDSLSEDKFKLLMDDRMVSHYCWKNDEELVVYARKSGIGDHYYLLNVVSGEIEPIAPNKLDQYGDGHPSVSPDGNYILTDSYPDKSRHQHVLLYHIETNKIIEAGSFFAPWKFYGEIRCDLHPRWSPDGKLISIDSTHEGKRQSYIINVENLD